MQPPPPQASETVPFTMTVKGELIVPAGTNPELIKASVMSQVNISASLVHSCKEIDIKTGAPGLAIVKG